ncbi:hypothetical protein [Pendulispora albinea]|uniref:Lipoprotein n=1 Tax=Pendulispora albinea TaxID=2741071 RepID=A0ABZ2LSW2_9BACT
MIGRHRLLLSGLALMCASSVLSAGCAKSSEESLLQASDFVTPKDVTFDANSIMSPEVLQDAEAFDAAALQTFLERTPYRRPSFLATYQSNGVRASDALYRAAIASRINPFVLLVRAQALQGLVGTQFYPFPPSRVEYVFRCGCAGGDTCDASLAGFDRQATCLANRLRQDLDQIASKGATAGGWGPGKLSVTLDHQKVTPKDASTAALYQEDPAVGVGKSDAWLFWNIWQNYSEFLQYIGPRPSVSTQGGWIGDACTRDAECSAPNAICNTNFPGGMCMSPCTDSCPSEPGRAESFCADFGKSGGYCLPMCNANEPGSCRPQYECRTVQKAGKPGQSSDLCTKAQSG